MLQWECARVIGFRESWPGVQRLRVRIEDLREPSEVSADGSPAEGRSADLPGEVTASAREHASSHSGEELRALAYVEMTGEIAIGERVLLNTNALRRELGTGGEALVVARLDVLPTHEAFAGHMVKARYAPLQTMVDALDDPASEHYETVRAATSIEGMPVVVADLHSSLPAIAAGIRATRPKARIVHVHTDAAALPAVYSRTASVLRTEGILVGTISAGQAFGGDLEAVTVHSALLGAREVMGADVVIAVQGPGNLGTGTGWGFSGVQGAEAVHATHVLGGRAVAALRVSTADPRERHRGLSHHSSTMFGAACLAPVVLPLLSPADPTYSAFHESVRRQVDSTIIEVGRERGIMHRPQDVQAEGLLEALRALPVSLSTMGRGLDEEPEAFLAAALAGRAAAALLDD